MNYAPGIYHPIPRINISFIIINGNVAHTAIVSIRRMNAIIVFLIANTAARRYLRYQRTIISVKFTASIIVSCVRSLCPVVSHYSSTLPTLIQRQNNALNAKIQ